MHLITEYLAVGDAEDAARPHWLMSAILNVASENRVPPSGGQDYNWLPFPEFAAAHPFQLDEAISWLEARENEPSSCLCRVDGASVAVATPTSASLNTLPSRSRKTVAARRHGSTPSEMEAPIRRARPSGEARKTDARITEAETVARNCANAGGCGIRTVGSDARLSSRGFASGLYSGARW